MDNKNDFKSSSTHTYKILLECISSENPKCLFLDIDGTLCDFQLNPQDCFIPAKTLTILDNIISHSIPVIAVTGRDIDSARRLFNTIELPIAALHGLEIYLNQEEKLDTNKKYIDIAKISRKLSQACLPYPELLIENKKSSIALHYRRCPQLEATAKQIILDLNKDFPELKLIEGKFVLELISPEASKGLAIKNMLAHLNPTKIFSPIFIGDDVTDEDGFAYVNQIEDGISIKVGTGLTQARYRLENIEQVHNFLELFLKHIQNDEKNMIFSNYLSGEKICLN